MPTPILSRQIDSAIGIAEASAIHLFDHFGCFSLNWQSPASINEARNCHLTMADISDYLSGNLRLSHAEHAGALSVGDRIAELLLRVDGKRCFPMRQRLHPSRSLQQVISGITEYPERLECDFWISQNSFKPGSRQSTNLRNLNMLFIDLDISKFDEKQNLLQISVARHLRTLPPEQQAEFVVGRIIEDGIPAPSYVVFSGGGLHLKWLFDGTVPPAAKPVWDKLEEHLIARCINLGLPVDPQVCDVSRILRLVGTINQRWGKMVDVVWVNGDSLERCIRYNFNDLADGKTIMPWSRPEAREMKRIGKIWDKNRMALAHANPDTTGHIVKNQSNPNRAMCEFIAKDMWHAD